WHGVWEMQHKLQEMVNWGAEHGDEEAKVISESTSPTKYMPYKLYDFPGNEWGIGTEKNRTPVLYKLIPDYWEKIKANVEAATDAGLLTKAQLALWMKRYNNKEHYLGTKYPPHPIFEAYKARNKKDMDTLKKQGVNFKLPSPTPFDEVH
ncbi:MAG: cytochrome C, partial [Deltaproteobacteria bacterium]|nr:cytochrome C [Deltaproteobacteria bacterium]